MPDPQGLIYSSIVRDNTKDQLILEDFNYVRNSHQYQSILQFRERLPSFQCKDEILQCISNNQVVVISGEPGLKQI